MKKYIFVLFAIVVLSCSSPSEKTYFDVSPVNLKNTDLQEQIRQYHQENLVNTFGEKGVIEFRIESGGMHWFLNDTVIIKMSSFIAKLHVKNEVPISFFYKMGFRLFFIQDWKSTCYLMKNTSER